MKPKRTYKDRELDNRHEQIISRLDSIKEQVEETNGRVSNLENWRNRIVGAIAVLTPIVLYIFKQVVEISL